MTQLHESHESSFLEAGDFPVGDLAHFAVREGRRPRPIYTSHKWFARRLGCVFRALLVGGTCSPEDDFWKAYYGSADLTGLTVLDPFVGGGTSVVEAQRLGARVIGVDIDPVACVVTQFELGAKFLPNLHEALETLKSTVGTKIRKFHRTTDSQGVERCVLHHFWVQVVECGNCSGIFDAHPTYLLADDNTSRWAICSYCGEIAQRHSGQERFMCSDCRRYTIIEKAPVHYGRFTCPWCDWQQPLIDIARKTRTPPTWRLFAVEAIEEDDGGRAVPIAKRRFLRANQSDLRLFKKAANLCDQRRNSHPDTFPRDLISKHKRSDTRLIDYGYRCWTDLFNARQLLHLSLLKEAIDEFEGPTRHALAIAFSDHLTTNCMMTAYAAGWRRTSPLFSVRAFRHVPRPVELNPWCDGTGRGTYPNTIRKLMRAASYSRNPKEPLKKGGFKHVAQRISTEEPIIACAMAQDLSFVADRSVDIVLTDPPYFDNIAYSDLAEFFLPWMKLTGLVDDRGARRRILRGNLIGQRDDGESAKRFKHGISMVFREVSRVLKTKGLLVFSFRHIVADAWHSLAAALAQAKFSATHFLPVPGEAGAGLHNHKNTGLWDAVFVLRKHKGRAVNSLVVSDQANEYIKSEVTTWCRRLSKSKVSFTEVDKLTLYRAGLVAVSLGLLDRNMPRKTRTAGFSLLSELL